LGRFYGNDPVGFQAGTGHSFNRYAYVANNPYAYNDPNGEWLNFAIGGALGALEDIAFQGIMMALGAQDEFSYSSVAMSTGLGVATSGVSAYAQGGRLAMAAGKLGKKILGKGDDVAKKVPGPDGGFAADLSKSKAKSRSGHRNAGNKQINDKMKSDPNFRGDMENRHGSDVFDRTSTSGSGRRNPANTEWDHSSTNPNSLDLRTTGNHRQKTSAEGLQGGGWKRFHRD